VTVKHSSGLNESAKTGEDGTFYFGAYTTSPISFSSGAYTIEASAPGYVESRESGARRSYQPGDDISITLVKGGAITGRVTNASGEPVIGVHVRAVPVRAMNVLEPNASRLFSARLGWERLTDERGIYRLFGLETGDYLIVA